MSNYIHHIPGRLRVRSATIRRNEVKASAARTLLESVPGVASVEANTLTGSIVIRYDPETTTHPALVEILRERGYLTHTPTLPARSAAVSLYRRPELLPPDLGSEIAKKVARYVIETAVERSVVAVVAALL